MRDGYFDLSTRRRLIRATRRFDGKVIEPIRPDALALDASKIDELKWRKEMIHYTEMAARETYLR